MAPEGSGEVITIYNAEFKDYRISQMNFCYKTISNPKVNYGTAFQQKQKEHIPSAPLKC